MRRAARAAVTTEVTRIDWADGTPSEAHTAREAALFRQAAAVAEDCPGTPRSAATCAAGTSAYSSHVTTPLMS